LLVDFSIEHNFAFFNLGDIGTIAMFFPLQMKLKKKPTLWVIVLLTLMVLSCKDKASEYTEIGDELALQQLPDSVDYSFHIKPILSDRCFACHGPDKNAIEAGLSLNSAEDAYAPLGENKDRHGIVPGDVENSEILKRIFTEDNGILMPPPESNLVLSEYEKALLKKWVAQGAQYKRIGPLSPLNHRPHLISPMTIGAKMKSISSF